MCQPKPGPRCSGHMREALMKAEERLATAKSDLTAFKQDEQNPTPEQFSSGLLARMKQRQRAVKRVQRAQRRHDATPEGLKQLESAQREGLAAASQLRDTIEAERRNPLKRKEASAELQSTLEKNTELADRYDRARTRLQFERQALRSRKDRAAEIDRLESLAQTGNVTEMRTALDDYVKTTIPVHIDSQIDEEPQVVFDGGTQDFLLSSHRTFKATTADGGQVDIEVSEKVERELDGSTTVHYRVTPKFKAQKAGVQWYGRGGFGNYEGEAEPKTHETSVSYDSPVTAAQQIVRGDTNLRIKNLAAEAVVEQSKRENLAHARILLGECLRQQRRNIQDRLARGE